MRRILATTCLLAGLAVAGCGGDDDDKKATKCLSPAGGALTAAAREHAKIVIVGTKVIDREADRVEVDPCRTSDEDATATVTVRSIPDDEIRDQRHELTLERKSARWVVVRDLDTQRCRKGHGHKDFSSLVCE